jgi:trans-aconitate methyltransferase
MTAPTNTWDAGLYESKHAFVWQHGAQLLDLLQPRPGERILDLGCGTGQLTAQVAAAGASVLGIDLSQEMIATARRNYPDLQLDIADARRLPYQAEFDAVLSNAVLHWVLEAEDVAHSVARALKPGGRFVAEFGGRGNVQNLLGGLQRACRRVLGEEVASPWYFPSIAAYATLVEKAGLEATYAILFDRPTPLEGDTGLRHWVTMFGNPFLKRVPAERHEEFFRVLEEDLRPALCRDGTWFADYRSLRVVAWRAERRKPPG